MYTHIPVPTVKLPKVLPTAESVLNSLQVPLHPTAAKLFTLLFETALHRSQSQQHPVTPTSQVVHQPVEIIAAALGLSRVSVYKHLKVIKSLGLVDHRSHFGSWFGLTRSTGTLFSVVLRPGVAPARLTYADLHHCHRNLQADTQAPDEERRTAWKFLQCLKGGLQSRPESQRAAKSALRRWAIKPGQTQKPVKDLTVNPEESDVQEIVYSLESLSYTHPTGRAALIDSFSRALSRGFLDSENLMFWRKLLWDALKRDFEGLGTLHKLQSALTRLMADVEEWKDLHRPGALLVSRLKACGLWDELKYT